MAKGLKKMFSFLFKKNNEKDINIEKEKISKNVVLYIIAFTIAFIIVFIIGLLNNFSYDNLDFEELFESMKKEEQ